MPAAALILSTVWGLLPGAGAQSRPVGPGFFDGPKHGPKTRPKTRPSPRPKPPAATRPATRPATHPATRPAATKPAARPRVPANKLPGWPAEPLGVRVDRAIRQGLGFLYGAQKPDGTWDSKYAAQHPGGIEALVLWTALSAGEEIDHPKLAAALKHVDALKPQTTYVRAARALAFARLPAGQWLDRLREDASWLAARQNSNGGWGYGPGYHTTRKRPSWTDLSNTFLAVRALRDADEAGAAVPSNVWGRCRIHLSRAANADGGLGYQPPGGAGFRLRSSSYGSMTLAGAVAMLILADKGAALEEADFANAAARRANPSRYQKAVDRAIAWLAANYTLQSNPRWVWVPDEAYEYYYLWCLQQLATAGGLRKVGGKPFVEPAAEVVVSRQRPDGSWGQPGAAADADDKLVVVRTCFAILSLIEARTPVIVYKLALGERAANDPRDAAHLTRWLARTFPWQAGWCQATPETPAEELRGAPVLYVQTSATEYPAELDAKLRSFLAGGGTIVVQPFAGEDEAVQAALDYFRRLLPGFTHGPVPHSHPIFSVHFKIPPAGRPRMLGLGDGCRTRVFILTTDVSGAWHQGRSETHAQWFQLGANLLLYTTDLAAPRGRFGSKKPPPAAPKPARAIRLARVKHGGDWDACPQALGRLDEVLARAVSIGVRELPAVDLAQPVDPNVPLLWMTGTRAATLPADQKARLKQYVAAGGMLFIDSAMGDMAFASAAAEMLTELFGTGSLQPLPSDHPLLTGTFAGGMGSNVTKVRFTRAAAAEAGAVKAPNLMGIQIDGRLAVVLSTYSVTCPLLGQPTYACKGLAGPDAARLAANVVLYAATRPADK